MKIKPIVWGVLLAGVVLVGSAAPAKAQFIVAPAPVVSYYYAPQAAVYSAPVAGPVVVPQVAYYTAPPVAYYAAPAVAYYPPAVVAYPPYPVTVTRGLFGRTTVRSPFYKVKY